MAKAVFVASTGRVSTQFLAKTLAAAVPDALVEHEALGAGYQPRRIFRRPQQVHRTLGANVPLQRKLIQIEDLIASGTPYVETGWPAYAWIPYLDGRLGPNFGFLHLVRAPFDTAASLLTHGLFSGSGKGLARQALIYGTDPGVAYPQFREAYPGFSAFEKCLYHWIEVNAFLRDQRSLTSWLGLVRFEELYGDDAGAVQRTVETILGRSVPPIPTAPFDRYQKTLEGELLLENAALAEAAKDLAVSLGYDRAMLDASLDLDAIADRYGQRRLAKPKRGKKAKAG